MHGIFFTIILQFVFELAFVVYRVVRTRDERELDKCDIVLDVGGVYDPRFHRYDHHQK